MIEYTEDSVIMSWNGKGRLFDKLHTEYDKFEEQLNKDQKFITIHKLLNNPEKMKVLEKICYDNNCDEYISRTYSELYDKYKDLCSTIVNRYSYIIDDYKWERLSDGMQNYYDFENYLADNIPAELANKVNPDVYLNGYCFQVKFNTRGLSGEESHCIVQLLKNYKKRVGKIYCNKYYPQEHTIVLFRL